MRHYWAPGPVKTAVFKALRKFHNGIYFLASFFFSDNPCPQQGDIVNIRLSEAFESVQQPDMLFRPMMVDSFFQMNYSTGEWKRIKKYRNADPEWCVLVCWLRENGESFFFLRIGYFVCCKDLAVGCTFFVGKNKLKGYHRLFLSGQNLVYGCGRSFFRGQCEHFPAAAAM